MLPMWNVSGLMMLKLVLKVDFSAELETLLIHHRMMECIIHLDLDVLDTSVGKVNEFSAPGGLSKQDLIECLQVIADKVIPRALTVAYFDPTQCDEETIAKVAIHAIKEFLIALK
jgi:arginase